MEERHMFSIVFAMLIIAVLFLVIGIDNDLAAAKKADTCEYYVEMPAQSGILRELIMNCDKTCGKEKCRFVIEWTPRK